ncbi:hypothetical protein BOTBODRAFT_26064 [Botryobasidium botryosum FD-172 SS1]|uniref:Uncharacterized protein n=1 Tax=Botryobasidium botryosum (strain FD-172 SS1) TaxID=930990 RepID=A0A067NBX0_BOTB1|nr:hypothetical protein BOTBODRAFT_26064 [Botryobasidium botryosum FD-172 SS1]
MKNLARDLPTLPNQTALSECLDETVFPITALALVLFHTATITLHSLIAKRYEDSRQRCLTAARATVDVIARVDAIDSPCVIPLQAILAVSTSCSAVNRGYPRLGIALIPSVVAIVEMRFYRTRARGQIYA